jgi:hypothetical protein
MFVKLEVVVMQYNTDYLTFGYPTFRFILSAVLKLFLTTQSLPFTESVATAVDVLQFRD